MIQGLNMNHMCFTMFENMTQQDTSVQTPLIDAKLIKLPECMQFIHLLREHNLI